MRKLLVLGGAALLGGALGAWALLAREGGHYGAPFRGSPPVDLGLLVGNPAGYLRKEVQVDGRLARQCPARGCWFFLQDGQGRELRVEMGEATPRLPPRVGRRATVEGQLIRFGETYEFVGTAVTFH